MHSLFEWASDQTNSNLVRTGVALLAIPGALWGTYLFIRWTSGRGLDATVDTIRLQNIELQRAFQALAAEMKAMQPGRVRGNEETPDVRFKRARLTTEKFNRAFLSFANTDRELVLSHLKTLQAVGISPTYLDAANIPAGEDWMGAIRRAIDSTDVFVLFWSKAAAESEFVKLEIDYALSRIKAGALEFYPIQLEHPAPPVPDSLRDFHFGQLQSRAAH